MWLDEEIPETRERARTATLVVEDDPDVRECMLLALGRHGQDADAAGTLLEGLAKLTPEARWLVLDLSLPDGDGAALLRYVRENRWGVKVAVVTGFDDGAALADVALLKPDGFFLKPVGLSEVAALVAGHVP